MKTQRCFVTGGHQRPCLGMEVSIQTITVSRRILIFLQITKLKDALTLCTDENLRLDIFQSLHTGSKGNASVSHMTCYLTLQLLPSSSVSLFLWGQGYEDRQGGLQEVHLWLALYLWPS